MPRLGSLHVGIVKRPGLLPMHSKVGELAETLSQYAFTTRMDAKIALTCNTHSFRRDYLLARVTRLYH